MGYNLVINVVFWVYNPLTYLLLISWEILVGFIPLSQIRSQHLDLPSTGRSRFFFFFPVSGLKWPEALLDLDMARSFQNTKPNKILGDWMAEKLNCNARWVQFHQLWAGLWKPPLLGTHLVDDYESLKLRWFLRFWGALPPLWLATV